MTNKEAIQVLLMVEAHGTIVIQAKEKAIKALQQELKKGHWIIDNWNFREHYTCSECNHVVNYEPCYHYCPYCGAKMEGGLNV